MVGQNVFFISWKRNDISTEAFLNMRYDGTDCALMCTASERDVSTVIRVISDNIVFVKTIRLYYSTCRSSFRSQELVIMVTLRKHF